MLCSGVSRISSSDFFFQLKFPSQPLVPLKTFHSFVSVFVKNVFFKSVFVRKCVFSNVFSEVFQFQPPVSLKTVHSFFPLLAKKE